MTAGVPFGRYTLVRRLARGGMAEIFLALQEGPEGFSRRLVIKRILPHLGADPSFLRMFLDEARIVSMLSHPHIVHLYDFGEVEGSYYLAMEYVEGVDLKQLGDRVGPVPAEHAAKIMSYVCEGLNHAHELTVDGRSLGLVHRDVTPSNILISYDGIVKVADFGIAKTYSGDDRTRAGVVKGKFAYLSPEQARGLPLDRRSDQFNVGILLYETLTGANLFPHDSFQRAMRAIIGGDIEPPEKIQPTVPPRLSAIVMKALSPRRDDRYPDTLALRADLESFLREWPEPSDAIVLGKFIREAFPDRHAAQHTGKLPQGTAPLQAGTAAAALHTRTAAPSGTASAGRAMPALLVPTQRETPLSLSSEDEEVASGLGVALVDDDTVLVENAGPGPASLHDAQTDLHGTVLPDLDEEVLTEEATQTNTLAAPPRASTAPSAWDIGRQKRSRGRLVAISLSVGLAAALATAVGLVWTGGAPASEDLPSAPPDVPPLPPRPVRPPAPGSLWIASEPAGAQITVDGEPTPFVTPSQVGVAGGIDHRVQVVLEGYDPVERVVAAAPDSVVEVSVTLTRTAALPVAVVDAGVAEAGPVAVALPDAPTPGQRHGPGPRGPRGDRGRDAGTTRPSGAVGYLSVDTMPWSKVYLGGRYLGSTPIGERPVPVGRHVLKLVNPELGVERRVNVVIEPEQTRRVRMPL